MQEPTHDRIAETAKALGLDLPEACRSGVQANLELLAQHARVLDDYVAGDDA